MNFEFVEIYEGCSILELKKKVKNLEEQIKDCKKNILHSTLCLKKQTNTEGIQLYTGHIKDFKISIKQYEDTIYDLLKLIRKREHEDKNMEFILARQKINEYFNIANKAPEEGIIYEEAMALVRHYSKKVTTMHKDAQKKNKKNEYQKAYRLKKKEERELLTHNS